MYVDVTLVSEDFREVPAHKIVLSSGSKVENILIPVKPLQFDNILSGAAPNPESVSAAAPRDRAAGSASRGARRGAEVPHQKIFGIL